MSAITNTTNVNAKTLTDLAGADEFLLYDASAAAHRKITAERAFGWGGNMIPRGRLTTESGVAVSTSSRTSQGTLYYTPYNGNTVRLYDGTRWKLYTFTERSLALTLTADKNYDVFLYENAGTLTLELSAAWTNDTTRADALATQDGFSVKSGATTRLWLGTIRASGTNVTEDSTGIADTKRYVWNAYNRVWRSSKFVVTADHTYGTASWREYNAGTYRFSGVWGIGGSAALFWTYFQASCGTANTYCFMGIGENSTAAASIQTAIPILSTAMSNSKNVFLMANPALGYSYYPILQNTYSAITFTYEEMGAVSMWEC